jgi:modulator of FtsH protease
MVALLSAGLILFETSRIVNGGETNYVLATVGLFVSLFNLVHQPAEPVWPGRLQ